VKWQDLPGDHFEGKHKMDDGNGIRRIGVFKNMPSFGSLSSLK
jgi:hypothetical protein